MRRLLPVVLLAAAALTAPASAAPDPLPTPGFASENVEWLGNIPLHADTSGARLLDGYLYVTSSTQLSIYDARVPETPTLLSTFPVPQQAYFAEEDVDTNGEILLISTFGQLVVMDVKDKTAPAVLSVLQRTDEHTMSCVLDCAWAYGSAGVIVDLRDPANPTLVTTTTTDDGRFVHANLWPREMQDRLLLVGGETATTPCDDADSGAFMTFDTGARTDSGSFPMLDEYRPPVTSVPEGDAAYETYCSHWFTTRPGWEDGGQLAVSWYEHGTRFPVGRRRRADRGDRLLRAGRDHGQRGLPGQRRRALRPRLPRGLDILRFHDEGEAPARQAPGLDAGLAPDSAPLNPRRLLPGMLDGDDWRC